eukprot:SAG31_NODE_3398_length_4315_cov_1.326850_4_plen_302_part_00
MHFFAPVRLKEVCCCCCCCCCCWQFFVVAAAVISVTVEEQSQGGSLQAASDEFDKEAKEVLCLRHFTVISGRVTKSRERSCSAGAAVATGGGAPSTKKLGCTRRGRMVVSGLLALAAMMILYGSVVPSFEIKIYGIAGFIVDFGTPGASVERLSVISSALALARQAPARYGGSVGIIFLAAVYIGFSLLVPLVLLVLAMVQWLVPLTLTKLRQIEITCEALRASSSLLVFVVSIAISMVQLEQVSGFMVGNPCKNLDADFDLAARFKLLDQVRRFAFKQAACVCSIFMFITRQSDSNSSIN